MEGLNPALNLIWQVKKATEKGDSVRSGIKNFLQIEQDEWKNLVFAWLVKLEQGASVENILQNQTSPYRKHILILLERGLRGESIISALSLLEKETIEKVELDLSAFTAKMPYLLLGPLCLFLFPACLILMLGPFILQLTQSL